MATAQPRADGQCIAQSDPRPQFGRALHAIGGGVPAPARHAGEPLGVLDQATLLAQALFQQLLVVDDRQRAGHFQRRVLRVAGGDASAGTHPAPGLTVPAAVVAGVAGRVPGEIGTDGLAQARPVVGMDLALHVLEGRRRALGLADQRIPGAGADEGVGADIPGPQRVAAGLGRLQPVVDIVGQLDAQRERDRRVPVERDRTQSPAQRPGRVGQFAGDGALAVAQAVVEQFQRRRMALDQPVQPTPGRRRIGLQAAAVVIEQQQTVRHRMIEETRDDAGIHLVAALRCGPATTAAWFLGR